MAYYPYNYSNPYMTPQPQVQPQQQQSNGLIWVQGEAGAKSYLVAPNTTVLLMDSENQRFYLKSSDASGMPQPLRIFEYSEKTQNAPNQASESQSIDLSAFATKAEFDAFKDEINALLKQVPRQTVKKEVKSDG